MERAAGRTDFERAALLRDVMPRLAELPLLSHMKRDVVNGAEVDHAIVVCNRLPDASAPAGEKPQSFSAIQAFGLLFSHSENRSRWHIRQRPQAIGKGTTTRSPDSTMRGGSRHSPTRSPTPCCW